MNNILELMTEYSDDRYCVFHGYYEPAHRSFIVTVSTSIYNLRYFPCVYSVSGNRSYEFMWNRAALDMTNVKPSEVLPGDSRTVVEIAKQKAHEALMEFLL